MPPKKKAGKEKGTDGKIKKKKTIIVPNDPDEQAFVAEEEAPEEHDLEPNEDDEDEAPAVQRIVQFYEEHPYFYNIRHEQYRNTRKKEAELADLAKEISWTGKPSMAPQA